MKIRILFTLMLCIGLAGCGDGSKTDATNVADNSPSQANQNGPVSEKKDSPADKSADQPPIDVTFVNWHEIEKQAAENKGRITVIDLWSTS